MSPCYVGHLFLLHMEGSEVHRKGEFKFGSGLCGSPMNYFSGKGTWCI